MSSERKSLLLEAVLDALAVPRAEDREAQITKSHAASYSWLWEPEGEFRRFLKDPAQHLFWFSGKPGSGKSTLLRYIKNSRELPSALRQWSTNHELDTVSFFFWESGLVSQRSYDGALRSILHQLLSKRPHLISYAFPELWAFLETASTVERVRRLASWDLSELRNAVVTTFAKIESDGRQRVLLFLDGIDEFEGDPDDIVGLLKHISIHDSVKICVSSRPWPVFERAFTSQPHLRLQDATRRDMEEYVAENLRVIDAMRLDIAHTIVDRAEGVFLWATVAVEEVNRWNPELQCQPGTIDKLPLGLDSLYEYLLVDMASDSDRRNAAVIFKLITAREDACEFTRNDETALLTAWDLVLSRIFDDDDALVKGPLLIDGEQMDRLVHEEVNLAESCSRRLLKFAIDQEMPQHSPISFYHRTVRTWARSEKATCLLRYADQEPHTTLLRTGVLQFKVTHSPKPKRTRNILGWWSQIVTLFTHARLAPENEQDRVFDLMMGINRTLDNLYLARQQPMSEHPPRSLDSWARTCFGTLESRGQMPYEDAFLALAIRFGLAGFVQRYLDRGLYIEGQGYPLLSWSTVYLFNRQASVYPLSDPRIIESLLAFGLDPNKRVEKPSKHGMESHGPPKMLSSPFETTVETCQQALRRGWVDRSDLGSVRWRSIIQCFRQYGADLAVTVKATHKDQTERAEKILEKLVLVS